MCSSDLSGIEDGRDIYAIKASPIGEDNQTKIVKAIKNIDFQGFDIPLMAVKRDWADKGIKHTFAFKVLGDTQFIEIKESEKKVEKPIVKDKKNKFREVKEYGKSSTNRISGSTGSDGITG